MYTIILEQITALIYTATEISCCRTKVHNRGPLVPQGRETLNMGPQTQNLLTYQR